MDRLQYKGYLIEAAPHRLADDGRWTLNINIARENGDTRDNHPFSAANTYETKDEAIQHSINFGRQIIDGTVAGCVAP